MIDQTYVKSGQVRIVIKTSTERGGLDSLSAEAALCASDQGKFWEYHDRLMESLYVGNRAVFGPAGLRQLALDLGLDAGAFAACLDEGRYTQRVEEEAAEAEQRGVTGTPTFFINDTMLVGAQPFAAFKTAIENALKEQ